ncbi:hypothetical protein MMC06_001439 [Schaereria dolodes]|nr:hypothetical protein [Schaereria dolodes]
MQIYGIDAEQLRLEAASCLDTADAKRRLVEGITMVIWRKEEREAEAEDDAEDETDKIDWATHTLQHRLEDGFLNAHLVDYVLRVSFDPALKKETPRVMSGQVLDGNAQLVMLLIALLDNGISDIGTSLSLQEEGKEEKGKER